MKKGFTAVLCALLVFCMSTGTVFASTDEGAVRSSSIPEVTEHVSGNNVALETGTGETGLISDTGSEDSVGENSRLASDESTTWQTSISEETADNMQDISEETVSAAQQQTDIKDIVEDLPGYGETLTLQYDDYYNISDLIQGYKVKNIFQQNVTSYQVSGGNKTAWKDSAVLTKLSDTMIRATGTGSAIVQLDGTGNNSGETMLLQVVVEPAPLTLMFLLGQSNMEGMYDSENLTEELSHRVVCQPGTVYSTYLPTYPDWAKKVTGISFSSAGTAENASDYVAGSLTGKTSVSGKTLNYKVDALTSMGTGKVGLDAAVAYQWNQLTGDKVWTVNTAWSATSITEWVPGQDKYIRTLETARLVRQTYEAEIAAGHYSRGDELIFWQQGEFDQYVTTVDYEKDFKALHDSLNQEMHPDAWGIITVRFLDNSSTTEENTLYMISPRAVQYGIGADTSAYKDTFLVSNVNEQWISDEGVRNYFKTAYPSGSFTYPMKNSSALLPTALNEIRTGKKYHYSQFGHNENGITAANGMYEALYGKEDAKNTTATFKNCYGKGISSITARVGQDAVLVPVIEPCNQAKTIKYEVQGSAVILDMLHGKVTGMHLGMAVVYAKDSENHILAKVVVNVKASGNYISEVGYDYTGLYYDNGTWYYLKNGWVDTSYTGLAENSNGWWYVTKGKIDFSFNGYVQNGNDWWRVENGKVADDVSSVCYGAVDGQTAWWHVVNGKVTFDTTVAENSNGWWYIANGKVDFNYTGIRSNSNGWWRIENGKVNFNYMGVTNNENGWWYLENGKVNFNYTGIRSNSNGWWRIENGKVNFNYTGVTNNENGWWYLENGKVNFNYTGIRSNCNGWWRIENGKVNFDYTGVTNNENGWWYIHGGKVDFSYNGVAQNRYGWWYIRGGKVDFSYNGSVSYNGKKYTVRGGKVQM